VTGDTDFRFLSGRICLDFTATLGMRWRDETVERLREPADLSRWAIEGDVTAQPFAVTAQDLRRARQLREAIYALLWRGGSARPVNRWAAVPPPPIALSDGRVVIAAVNPDGLLALIARDAVEFAGGPLFGRLRECSTPHCSLLYVDTSRAGNRRWCSMNTCGARAKMARYRGR
jgi:predicted RNA-binding Zn ribbon-like protein